MLLTADADIRDLLTEARTIAMVGASDRPDRPSYGVMAMLQRHGYRVIPVNPQITGEHVHGEFVFRELAQIGVPIDIVDIFRRPMAAGEAVDQAIAVGAKADWMQLGIVNEEAAAKAEAAGLKVVMDRCTKIEIMRLAGYPMHEDELRNYVDIEASLQESVAATPHSVTAAGLRTAKLRLQTEKNVQPAESQAAGDVLQLFWKTEGALYQETA